MRCISSVTVHVSTVPGCFTSLEIVISLMMLQSEPRRMNDIK